ncbi:MAG: hypothetical protein ACTHQM_07440 [Thermoanaerobaculia bacterium]
MLMQNTVTAAQRRRA